MSDPEDYLTWEDMQKIFAALEAADHLDDEPSSFESSDQFVSVLKPEIFQMIEPRIRRWNTPGIRGFLWRCWYYIQVPYHIIYGILKGDWTWR